MESENELLVEDYEKRTKSIFKILLPAGVAGILFFTICFIYGIVYIMLSVVKLI